MATRLELEGSTEASFDEILSPNALEFVAELHAEFEERRQELLRAREERRARLAEGEMLDFLPETQEIRDGDWTVAPVPEALQQRWVEITGPTDRKMVINALNSGADGFMADFEDANTPTWHNMVQGQINVRDAIMGTITYDGSDGRHYELGDDPATLLVRPRGWHLAERHIRIDDEPMSGSLFDFGMFFFNSGPPLIASGLAPFLYLPKMESHLEARLWNDVFSYAEDRVGMERGTIKATVLIETLPAAFEMDEILYELRDHSAGLNAGRWDYIFSAIKCFPDRREMVLPDRGDVTMTVPFMHAYTDLLAATCHRRGAHAMGGMAALIPSRRDEEANEKALAGVREDKEREVGQGYDGTWVAHPDLVPVAREVFEKGLGGAPNQLSKQRPDVSVGASDLLVAARDAGSDHRGRSAHRRQRGLPVPLLLAGRARRGGHQLPDGGRRHRGDLALADLAVGPPRRAARGRADRHRRARAPGPGRGDRQDPSRVGDETWEAGRPDETRAIFERVALSEPLVQFLTLEAYEYID